MAEHRLAAPQPKNELKQYADFFYKGGRAPAGSLRRRSFLQATRYILKFIFWRLVRYAKYALVGAAVAAVGTGVLGTVTTGAGWLLFPTSIPAGMVMGTVIGTVKVHLLTISCLTSLLNSSNQNQSLGGNISVTPRSGIGMEMRD